MTGRYSSEQYQFLFDADAALTAHETLRLRNQQVLLYRTKTIKAGNTLELEIFPVWDTANQVRIAKALRSPEKLRWQNEKHARKRFVRKANANFGPEDITITLDYADEPLTWEQAQKDIRNYLRRIKAYRQRHSLSELKYIYTTAGGAPTGIGDTLTRIHHHVIMSGMDRDTAERLWTHGKHPHCRRLQIDDKDGLAGLATYFFRQRRGDPTPADSSADIDGKLTSRQHRRWNCSKNLVEPQITSSDHKISRRRAARMAVDMETAPREILTGIYTDYELADIEIKTSPYVAGYYIYARLYRKPPPKKAEKVPRKGGAQCHQATQGDTKPRRHVRSAPARTKPKSKSS
ncbi:MAG: hypothetical protein LBQ80_01990 [Clostridium sp.]|jgi:hypothetical protein|nr:hypothetical protein [Clostridium sp.]